MIVLLTLSSTFPQSPLISPPGTTQLGSPPIHSPDTSPSSICTQGTDPLQQHRTSRPPCTAGATGSDGAAYRRATSATEDDYLYHESPHTDYAPAVPPRDDPPDGPGVYQDDRHFPRRTTLDMAVSNAAIDLKAAFNATAGLQHSPTISDGPAFFARGPGCCQQPSSPRPALLPAGRFPLHSLSLLMLSPLFSGLVSRCGTLFIPGPTIRSAHQAVPLG